MTREEFVKQFKKFSKEAASISAKTNPSMYNQALLSPLGDPKRVAKFSLIVVDGKLTVKNQVLAGG